MLVLVYSLISLSIFKTILDIIDSTRLLATYSLFLEYLIIAILLTMIIRSYFKQKQGRKEKLQRRLDKLNESLSKFQ